MANIWLDKRPNNENSGQPQFSSAKLLSARTHSVKKQAFGELKNVMHNQVSTPLFKGALMLPKSDVFPEFMMSASKSLRNDVLRKHQMKQNSADAQLKMENKLKESMIPTAPTAPKCSMEDENLFDYWDNPSVCCSKDCHKSDREIWSEMNALDDELLHKVISGGDPDSDFEDDKKSCCFELTDIMDALDNSLPLPSFGHSFLDSGTEEDLNFTMDMPEFTDDLNDLLI